MNSFVSDRAALVSTDPCVASGLPQIFFTLCRATIHRYSNEDGWIPSTVDDKTAQSNEKVWIVSNATRQEYFIQPTRTGAIVSGCVDQPETAYDAVIVTFRLCWHFPYALLQLYILRSYVSSACSIFFERKLREPTCSVIAREANLDNK
jgi:hypothetical protein